MLKEKRIAKDININFVLALINGPTRAIVVAPQIDKPDANKILSFVSNPNTFPKPVSYTHLTLPTILLV